MNIRSAVVVIGTLAAVVMMGDANPAEARGFGNRGGAWLRRGTGRSPNQEVRYYGPSFSVAPRSYRRYGQDSTQFQQRPWYYSRSGPIEYYRPYRPLYRTP